MKKCYVYSYDYGTEIGLCAVDNKPTYYMTIAPEGVFEFFSTFLFKEQTK